MSIEVRGVTHHFGAHKAIDGVDLTVEPGELVAVQAAVAVANGCPPRDLRRGSCR